MTDAVRGLQASENGVWIFGDSDHSDAESTLIAVGYEFLVLGEILYAPPGRTRASPITVRSRWAGISGGRPRRAWVRRGCSPSAP